MRFDKLTIKAQEVVAGAQERAAANQHAAVAPMHLLAAMLHESEGGIVKPMLEKVGAHLPRIQKIVSDELERLPKVSGGQLSVDPKLQEVFNAAQKEADKLKDEYISTEHLLLALLDAQSDAKDVLTVCGARREQSLAAL